MKPNLRRQTPARFYLTHSAALARQQTLESKGIRSSIAPWGSGWIVAPNIKDLLNHSKPLD